MRTIFQAFVDITMDYTLPFHGIGTSWCRTNATGIIPLSRGTLSIFRDGCWSGGANVTVHTGKTDSVLTYYDRHHSGVPATEVFSENDSFDWIFVSYRLHDISMFSVEEYATNLKQRLTELQCWRNGTGKPPKLVYLGLWAQNMVEKPLQWKWSASNTRAASLLQQ